MRHWFLGLFGATALLAVAPLPAWPTAASASRVDSATLTISDTVFTDGVTDVGFGVRQRIEVGARTGDASWAGVRITMPAALGAGVQRITGCTETVTDRTWDCVSPNPGGAPYALTIEYDLAYLITYGTDGTAGKTYEVSATLGLLSLGTVYASDVGTVSVRPKSDLSIFSIGPNMYLISYPDQPTELQVTFQNLGPSSSTDVRLTVSGYRAVAPGSLPYECGWSGTSIVCDVGALATSGPTATKQIFLPLPAAGAGLTFTATIKGLFPDPKTTNNTKTVKLPGGSGGGSGGGGSGGGGSTGGGGGAAQPTSTSPTSSGTTTSAEPTLSAGSTSIESTIDAGSGMVTASGVAQPLAGEPAEEDGSPLSWWLTGAVLGLVAAGGLVWWWRRHATPPAQL